MGTIFHQASWVIKKILKATKYVEHIGLREADLVTWEQFSIKAIYMKLSGEFQRVPWRRLVCNNGGAPRWLFILFLAIWGKILTRDRLPKRGCTENTSCALCDDSKESCGHLFFTCSFSVQVWNKLLLWQGIPRTALNWQ
ncbi:uncharacterized protein LOC132624570 [Lycium barbarum]|uniref:uncharacterized protein LOC132624570 n=1 Tax=Lycium barbarum TaxID=112863 RepID=UPI00293E5480|nr:uncharacterized protein LOC132624570 [Lycium barbarum]